jgi:hypothetical protein
MTDKYSDERTQILLESIYYDMLTGDFYWRTERPISHFKNQKGMNMWLGRDAGKRIEGLHQTNKKTPYPRIRFNGRLYLLHKVAWRILYGVWPESELDHIDRNGGNNVPTNLRLSNRFQQNQNKAIYKTNKLGIAGVYRLGSKRVRWGVRYGMMTLTFTDDFFEACCVRKAYEHKLALIHSPT